MLGGTKKGKPSSAYVGQEINVAAYHYFGLERLKKAALEFYAKVQIAASVWQDTSKYRLNHPKPSKK